MPVYTCSACHAWHCVCPSWAPLLAWHAASTARQMATHQMRFCSPCGTLLTGVLNAGSRFGEVDIITGRPVRDLRTEPVQQLAQWQRAIFGSRESVSESVSESVDGGSDA